MSHERIFVNAPATTALDYAAKEAQYFAEVRQEMLCFVPVNCRRLLDVGCGAGAFGLFLKQQRQIEVWGVEPFPAAAAKAAEKIDHVVLGQFEPGMNLPKSFFDCIVFNDVLEHMVEPELALRSAKDLLSPGGTIVASIPNVRHLPVLWQLAVHGRWDYQDCGVLDKTHLRFFTKSSMLKMFHTEGYGVKSIDGINPYKGIPNVSSCLWRSYRIANALSFGRLSDLKFQQFVVIAERKI